MSLVRILQTTRQTLTHTFRVDGVLTDVTGDVTATLKRLDGTSVEAVTAGHAGVGTYTYTPPAQALLDSLTLDWSGTLAGAAVSVRDYVEIVGGHLFDLAEARAAHSGLSSESTYPWSLLAAKRIEVEQECEGICRRAFVPRFSRRVLDGNDRDRLAVPDSELRAVRAVSVGGVAWLAPDVAALGFTDFGTIVRPGGALWPAGLRNVVLEYEHGLDFPPGTIREAGILRLRSRIAVTRSGVPDRATSYTVADGGVYRLSMPGKERTGVPEVDGAYEKHTRARRAVFA